MACLILGKLFILIVVRDSWVFAYVNVCVVQCMSIIPPKSCKIIVMVIISFSKLVK
jgi:hypothetical protein